jgi:hypothetical protein
MKDLEMIIVGPKGVDKIVIQHISKSITPSSQLESLGTAEGRDETHCVYMANKYCAEFRQKVRFYEEAPPVEDSSMIIKFYGGKK